MHQAGCLEGSKATSTHLRLHIKAHTTCCVITALPQGPKGWEVVPCRPELWGVCFCSAPCSPVLWVLSPMLQNTQLLFMHQQVLKHRR